MNNYRVRTSGIGVPYEMIVQANSRWHAIYIAKVLYPGLYDIYSVELMDSSN